MLLYRGCVIFTFIVLRALLQLSGISEYLVQQQILSTPLTSQLRVREALSLTERGHTPYDTDIIHETPLVIALMATVTQLSDKYGMILLFLLLDILTGLTMLKGIEFQRQFQKQHENRRNLENNDTKNSHNSYNEIRVRLQLTPDEAWDKIKLTLFALYFLNPLTLLVSATQSSVIIHNYVFSLCFYSSLKSSPTAPIYLAVATYLNMYSLFLIVPFFLIIRRKKNVSVSLFFTFYSLSLVCLLLGSKFVFNDLNYLSSVYGCLLTVSDYTPNLGFFWYFFMLTFQHFNAFFIAVFQLIIPSLLILLTCRFHRDPSFLLYTTISVICIFKSYPSLGDAILPLFLAFSWSHLFPCLRQVLIVIGMFIATCALLPGFYFLWMYSGFGNANFFFAISLVYSLAHLFFVTDMMRAYLSREKFLDYCELQTNTVQHREAELEN